MKNKRLKKYIRETVILAVVFVAAVEIFSYFTNRGNDNMTADMGAATFPQISFAYDGYSVNTLPGYAQEMDTASMRDTITPVVGGHLDIVIDAYENEIRTMKCTVYSLDGEQKLLETETEDPSENVSVEFPDPSVLSEERTLMVTLGTADGRTVYYYTRIVDAEGKHASESLDYIRSFHENAMEKREGVGVGAAIEPSDEGDNTTLQHVTIHSDYDHVTWGALEPEVDGGESWLIKELNNSSCSVRLEYRVRCNGEENKEDLYSVKEFFRVRYDAAAKNGLLLDYDRTMDQIFNPSQKILNEKGILLGIASAQTPYMVSRDGTKVSFVQADELWHYNRDTDELSLVFSFASAENTDERNLTAQHRIEILRVGDSGNVSFAVYGYMNRGEHEGDVGVAVYEYNIEQNSVEEKAFVSTNKAYGFASLELGELLYYSPKTNDLFMLVDDVLYQMNTERGSRRELVDGLSRDRYVISKDRDRIAYRVDQKDGSAVQLLDLSTNEERLIEGAKGESVQPLGFMEDDFVYGVSRKKDTGESVTGQPLSPMYKVEIQDTKGKIVKTYEEKGVYVLSALFEDRLITLNRAKRKGKVYTGIVEDYITNNEEPKESNIYLETYTTTLKQRQARIIYSDGIADKDPKILRPKQILLESPKEFRFDDQPKQACYFVYGYGEQQAICDRAADAVRAADACGGVVVSEKQEYVWERGNRDLQYSMEQNTGAVGNLRKRLRAGATPVEAAQALNGGRSLDLSGCAVEELLYIIDQGRPVIAVMNEKRSVILTGYTESTITYVDVKDGRSHTVSQSELEKQMEKNGSTYVA